MIKSFSDLELSSVVKASDDASNKLQDRNSNSLISSAGVKSTASVSSQEAHTSYQPTNQIQTQLANRTRREEFRNFPHIVKETKRLEELARTLEQMESKIALDQAEIAKECENLNAEKLALQNLTDQVIANQREISEKEKANKKRSEELDLREARIMNAEPDALSRLAIIKQKELELKKLMTEALRPEAEFEKLKNSLAKAQRDLNRKCNEVTKLIKTIEEKELLHQNEVLAFEKKILQIECKLWDEEESHKESKKKVKMLSDELFKVQRNLEVTENERDRLSQAEIENRSLRVSINKMKDESIVLKQKLDDSIRKNTVRLKAAQSSPAKVVEPASPFSINSKAVLGWLSSAVLDAFQPPDDVVSIGSGPFPERAFDEYLKTLNITPYSSGCNWVIVGRTGWTPQQLEELIEDAEPGELRIFSQELFIAGQLSTHDPFSADHEILMEFAKGHPALEYLRSSGFEWPIIDELEDLGVPRYLRGSYSGEDESPIYRMGYVVGSTNGLSPCERQRILKRAFEGVIPHVGDSDYMAEWGNPNTRVRLWRIAHHLAWLIRSRRKNPAMVYAVDHWAKDLDWLESTFYKSRMKFSWPYV